MTRLSLENHLPVTSCIVNSAAIYIMVDKFSRAGHPILFSVSDTPSSDTSTPVFDTDTPILFKIPGSDTRYSDTLQKHKKTSQHRSSPLHRGSPFIGELRCQAIQMEHSPYIAERTQNAVYIVRCLWSFAKASTLPLIR
jgi:hypothetical protein